MRKFKRSAASTVSMETFEPKRLLSTKTIEGTSGHDTLVADYKGPTQGIVVTLNGQKKTYPYGDIHRINYNLKGGHDSVTINGIGFDGGQLTVVYGEDGNDTIKVKIATIDVHAYGGNGSDRLDAGGGVFYASVYYQSGVRFWGGAGNDYLRGSAGDDDLRADSGNDTVTGGTGWDTLRGGDGSDIIETTEPLDGGVIDGGFGYDAVVTPNSRWSDLTNFSVISIEELR